MRNSRSRRNKLQRKLAQAARTAVDPRRESARDPEPNPRPSVRQDPNNGQVYRRPAELETERTPMSPVAYEPVEPGPFEDEDLTAIEVEEVDMDDMASSTVSASTASTASPSAGSVASGSTSLAHVPEAEANAALARMVGNALDALAGTQQAVLNGQATVREILNVVVQDNFNLKDENRKLRDRMLELERALAEYQRREETRKERLEGRLRALEATVAALQQQVAQLVQIQRQQQRRRGWFG